MALLLADETVPYVIYFAHQCDARPFNRGAMKNIGFLAIKAKYPTAYRSMTFIFHDVDTLPRQAGLVHYNAVPGVVSHFYGYRFALGGIFAIKGADFERARGFPNFWGWGLEDNVMQARCLAAGLTIDRDCFYDIKDQLHIAQAFDGFMRVLSKRDGVVYKFETPDDLLALKQITFQFQNEFINVTQFTCAMDAAAQVYEPYDIRRGGRIQTAVGCARRVWSMKHLLGR